MESRPDPKAGAPPGKESRPETSDPATASLAFGAKTQESGAFPALYERLAPAIYAWASLRLRASLRHLIDPEDVVQEVWYRAVKRFETWEPARATFRGWIFRIAELVMIESFRGLRGRPLARGGAEALRVEDLHDEATSLSRRVARDESLRRVLAEITALDPEEQRLFLFRGLEDQPHEEVARRLGIEPAAVRKRWARLRDKLESLGLPGLLGETDPPVSDPA